MSKYRFKLETLRRLRERNRDEQRTRLADAYRAESLLAEQQQAVRAELAELQDLQRSIMEGQRTDVNQMIDAQRYQLALRAQQDTFLKQSDLLTGEIERRRQSAIEADRQVRVLDKLEDSERRQHRLLQERTATKQLDEMAIMRHERSRS